MSVSTPSPYRPEVPASIWSRSGRPRWATIIRLYIAISLIWIGFFFDGGIARWGWVAAGIGAFLLFPALIRILLRPVEREVQEATRRTASHRLGLLRARRLVRTFAPHAWKTAQEARLHLIAGDGQAAAQAYAETGRLAHLREPSALLLSAQVHAWIVAKDLTKARELSAARMKLGELGSWDRLHNAALELAAGKCGEGVIGELQELREALGEHPWILAGLTLAHEREGKLPEALSLAEEAKAAGAEEDELAATMLKRADKGMRAFKKNQHRQERKRAKAKEKKPAAEHGSGSDTKKGRKKRSEDPRSPRGSKKARKQARREARRRAKAEERQRRSEEAARRQRELKTRAQRASQPAPADVLAPQLTAAAQVAEVSVPLQSAPPVSAPVATAPATAPAEAFAAAAPVAPVAAPEVAPAAAAPAAVAPAVASQAPVIASPVAPRGGGVVLPPLVRPGERPVASSRAKPPPPPPTRARGPRTSVPTPRPPRLNLPRLVGNRSATGLPTRSAKPAAPGTPRVLAPPPAATPVKEESGEWGDLDTLFQD